MDILIFPYHDWRKHEKEGPRGRDLHLILSMINKESTNRILVINRPNSLAEAIKNREKKLPTYGKKIEGDDKFYRLSKINEKLFILDFFVLDLIKPVLLKRKWWAEVYSSKKIFNIIQRVYKSYLQNPITLTFNPFAYQIIKLISPDYLVYDIFDDFSDHPRFNSIEKNTAKSGMNYLIENSNKMIAVSNHFIDNLPSKNTLMVSNGFSSNFLKTEFKNTDLSNIDGPIVGYSGRISKRLNIQLLLKLISTLPHVSFVFIGEVYDEEWIKPLKQHKNVIFLGAKKNSELPNYFKEFSVGIVPHHADDFEKAGNSIKVFEYLACGIPVVSTNIGEVESVNDIIDVCDEDNDFIKNVTKYVSNEYNMNLDLTQKRKSYVKSHTWDSKTDSLLSFINN